MIQEISLQAIQGVRIGNAENTRGGTGCTVLLFPHGAVCSVDIRGGAPASRETALLDPVATAEAVHAVLLSGGSCLLYTSPSPRDLSTSRMPSSA